MKETFSRGMSHHRRDSSVWRNMLEIIFMPILCDLFAIAHDTFKIDFSIEMRVVHYRAFHVLSNILRGALEKSFVLLSIKLLFYFDKLYLM